MISFTARLRTVYLADCVTTTWFVSYRTPDTEDGWSWTSPDFEAPDRLHAAIADIRAIPGVTDVRVHATTTTVRALPPDEVPAL
ncbi:hypothetical protein OG216_34885 [Streptomycetaceae bacterium NBC_01309]